jgi:CheY-like chemotaxis protein
MQPAASRAILFYQNNSSPSLGSILERRGFEVLTAASPADLMALATTLQPDAVVLDADDGDDCRQVVETLKSTAETRDIPVVVVSAQLPESCETYAATVASWVRKPVVNADLVGAIEVACEGPSILLVEDDEDLARVMTTALQSHGIRTFHAGQGGEAIRLCRQHEPSLIVLDLGLPDMDGFAVVTSLRESATLGRVPLIVYSALDVGKDDRSRLRLGPTEFLTKSRCSLAEFEAHVVRLLETVTNRKEDTQHAA